MIIANVPIKSGPEDNDVYMCPTVITVVNNAPYVHLYDAADSTHPLISLKEETVPELITALTETTKPSGDVVSVENVPFTGSKMYKAMLISYLEELIAMGKPLPAEHVDQSYRLIHSILQKMEVSE